MTHALQFTVIDIGNSKVPTQRKYDTTTITSIIFVVEMVKILIFSARPGPWLIFPARPVINFFILGPFGPVKIF